MRAFIAADVSNDVIVKIQNEVFSASGWNLSNVKLVGPHNFHFTLIFLGEISDNNSDRIIDKLSGLSFEPITITYGGVGAFPKPSYARVVWVGVDSVGAQKLTYLANDITSRMSELGFRADKPFSAHLTFIRSRSRPINASYLSAKYNGKTFGSDRIDRIHLKKSELTPFGPNYSNVYTIEAKNE